MNTKLLKQKILDLAIRGKLVPQDPNDEPASVLLEQIKKEKEKLVKEGKIKKDKNESTIFVGDDKLHYEKLADGTIKNIEEELPFDIPNTWAWCRLKDVGIYKKGPFGSSLTKSMFVIQNNDTYKVYEQGNAINKTTTYGSYYITKEKFQGMKSFEVLSEDIIVSCAGTIGETYIIPDNAPKGIINQALMKISLYIKDITQFYLMYFNRIIRGQSNIDSKGSAIKNIPPFDVLKQYLIPIPPLSEQERIVSKIEELFKQVDAIEEEKQSLLKLIDKAKDKVLDLAMTGKLVKPDPNDEPASKLLEKIFEEKKKLAKEGKIKLSKDELLTPPISVDNDYYEKIGIKLGMVCNLIKPKMTDNNKLPYLEVKYLRNQIPCVYKKEGMVLQNGDTVILVDGENSGEIFHIREEGYMGSTFMKLVMSDYIFQPYIEMFITKNKQYLKDNKKGSAIPHLNKNLFYNLDINLPSLKTQELVYNIVKNLSLQLHQIKAELN